MTLQPDIEVSFHFYLNNKIIENYRPSHEVKDNYLTTGVHHYYDTAGDEIKGTITFLSPECYPNCLYIGKIIKMYEGKNEIGYAKVLKIFNEILEQHYREP